MPGKEFGLSPEVISSQAYNAVFVPGNLDTNFPIPRLDPTSRWALFTAAVIRDAEAAGEIRLLANTQKTADKMEDYIRQGFNLPNGVIQHEISNGDIGANIVRRMIKRNAPKNKYGIITGPIDDITRQAYLDVGLDLILKPPDEILVAVASSRKVYKQLAQEVGSHLFQSGNVMAAGDVHFYDIKTIAT